MRFGGTVFAILGCIIASGSLHAQIAANTLRVCFDQNNLPYSNARGEGFENKIAQVIGSELNMKIESVWWGPRGDFVDHTLKDGRCEAVMELPTKTPGAITTIPYFRSSYVFLYRAARRPDFRSLDDSRLKTIRIGAQIVGNDYCPPIFLLSQTGVRGNFFPFSMYGHYTDPKPQAHIVEAVARGDVDVAFVWGPVAGYFGPRQAVPLKWSPIPGDPLRPDFPMAYDISVGLAPKAAALRQRIDAAIERSHVRIDRILHAYGVPLVEPETKTAEVLR